MIYPFYVHGSHDSLDRDIHYIVLSPQDRATAKAIADQSPDGNANLIYIEDGQVAWTYKGAVDEINNALFDTYGNHNQTFPLQLTKRMERNVGIKVVRTIRGMLGQFTRSERRIEIKETLRSPSIKTRIAVLDTMKPSELSVGDRDPIEVYKFVAFQLGQTLALLDGVELYTKGAVAEKYPKLHPYLYREAGAELTHLDEMWTETLEAIKAVTFEVPFDEGIAWIQDKWLVNVLEEAAIDYTITTGEDAADLPAWTDQMKAEFAEVLGDIFKWEMPEIKLPDIDLPDLPNPLDLLD